MLRIAKIDKFGRVLIPKGLRENAGFHKNSIIIIEEQEHSLVLKPAHNKASDIIEKISKMNLPVEDWGIMEKEIEEGALDG